MSAQIVNIVTAYCALTEDRSYRSAFSKEKAVEILGEEAGVKFNPALYDVLYMNKTTVGIGENTKEMRTIVQ